MGGAARMRRLGSRGGSLKRVSCRPLSELGPLDDLADAMRWLELIGRTVASGETSPQIGRVLTRVVEAWSDLHSQQRARRADEDRTPSTWHELMCAVEEDLNDSELGKELRASA